MTEEAETRTAPDETKISFHVYRAVAVFDPLRLIVVHPDFHIEGSDIGLMLDLVTEELRTAIQAI